MILTSAELARRLDAWEARPRHYVPDIERQCAGERVVGEVSRQQVARWMVAILPAANRRAFLRLLPAVLREGLDERHGNLGRPTWTPGAP